MRLSRWVLTASFFSTSTSLLTSTAHSHAVHEVDINITHQYEKKVDIDVKKVAVDVKVVTHVKAL